MRFAAAIALSLAMTTSAGADGAARSIMAAAVTAMEHLTLPRGKLTIYSGELAKSDAGISFRKMADCVYGLEERDGKHLELVDFGSLTGKYEWAGSRLGYDLVFDGRSERTRCFLLDGSTGCQHALILQHRAFTEIRPIVDAVTLILRSGCALPR